MSYTAFLVPIDVAVNMLHQQSRWSHSETVIMGNSQVNLSFTPPLLVLFKISLQIAMECSDAHPEIRIGDLTEKCKYCSIGADCF